MKWNDLKTNPPTGNEYAVILFPCRSDCGILYIASNPHYAIKHGVEAGYTHWAEIELAPTHAYWCEWQEFAKEEEITQRITIISENPEIDRRKAAKQMAEVFKKNSERYAQEVHDFEQEVDPKPLLRKVDKT